mmetsp:Transcript_72878/g.171370  ORF Transcript_72878/g.171370 Transcript_72878/m.171370 type:complete len:216 (+) Transcript_72878:213-860(+)
MSTSGQEILAVQSFRNHIMAASFFASTAAIVGFSSLSFAFSSKEKGDDLLSLQTGLLGMLCLLAFYNFGMVPRILAHTAYLMHIKLANIRDYSTTNLGDQPPESDVSSLLEQAPDVGENEETDEELFNAHICDVQSSLKRNAIHFWLGNRCIYCCIPIVTWILGRWFFVLGSVAVLCLLVVHDIAPAPQQKQKRLLHDAFGKSAKSPRTLNSSPV